MQARDWHLYFSADTRWPLHIQAVTRQICKWPRDRTSMPRASPGGCSTVKSAGLAMARTQMCWSFGLKIAPLIRSMDSSSSAVCQGSQLQRSRTKSPCEKCKSKWQNSCNTRFDTCHLQRTHDIQRRVRAWHAKIAKSGELCEWTQSVPLFDTCHCRLDCRGLCDGSIWHVSAICQRAHSVRCSSCELSSKSRDFGASYWLTRVKQIIQDRLVRMLGTINSLLLVSVPLYH